MWCSELEETRSLDDRGRALDGPSVLLGLLYYSAIEASHVIVRSLPTLQAALRKYRTLRHTARGRRGLRVPSFHRVESSTGQLRMRRDQRLR